MKDSLKTERKILDKFIDKFWFAPNDGLLRAIETVVWNNYSFKGKKTLAIGIGDGRHDVLIFQKHKKIDVGIDIDQEAIGKARKVKLYKKVFCESAEDIHFENNSFDIVLSNSTFEHMENDLKAIGETSRVLKQNGKFLFSVPTKRFTDYLTSFGLTKKKVDKINKRLVHKHYRNLSEWTEILKKNKMEIIRYYYYMDRKLLKVWYNLFKIISFKPYHRELWSYLKDSPYGRLVPKKFVSFALKIYLREKYKKSFNKNGAWVFIEAVKK